MGSLHQSCSSLLFSRYRFASPPPVFTHLPMFSSMLSLLPDSSEVVPASREVVELTAIIYGFWITMVAAITNIGGSASSTAVIGKRDQQWIGKREQAFKSLFLPLPLFLRSSGLGREISAALHLSLSISAASLSLIIEVVVVFAALAAVSLSVTDLIFWTPTAGSWSEL